MSLLSERLLAMGVQAYDVGDAGGFVMLPAFPVHLGRHKGVAVDIAIVGHDFPTTPPAGVHIRARWGADRPNVHASPLGPDWRYFSRKLEQWRSSPNPHSIVAFINRVLADA